MRIVLASSSPSRRAILRSAGVEPLCHPADIDERAIERSMANCPPGEIVTALAQAKAEAIADLYPGDIVIGCDSMLLLGGRLQGKPHTVEKTIERWLQQRGTTATLLTGHCVMSPRGRVLTPAETRVTFASACRADIEAYARTGEPLECAGAFTLEAIGGWFIDSIEGDPSSVIGLSLPVVREALYTLGYTVADVLASPQDTTLGRHD